MTSQSQYLYLGCLWSQQLGTKLSPIPLFLRRHQASRLHFFMYPNKIADLLVNRIDKYSYHSWLRDSFVGLGVGDFIHEDDAHQCKTFFALSWNLLLLRLLLCYFSLRRTISYFSNWEKPSSSLSPKNYYCILPRLDENVFH